MSRGWKPRGAGLALLAATLGIVLLPPPARGDDLRDVVRRVTDAFAPPGLEAGAVEVGLAGTLVSAGTTSLSAGWRVGGFLGAGRGRLGLEGSLGWARVSELDRVELLATAGWSPWSEGAALPYVALVGGLDQEWVGSFSDRRGVLGGGVGLRSMIGRRALVRTDYRYLRVLDDAVDRDRHVVEIGLSLLFRNDPRPDR